MATDNLDAFFELGFDGKAFTIAMQKIAEALSSELEVAACLDSDMNYSSSQRISIYVNPYHELLPCLLWTQATYRIDLYISGKGPFYTCFLRRAEILNGNQRRWILVDPQQTDDTMMRHISHINKFVENMGYESIPEHILQSKAPGHFTQIDNSPATVFEVLFAEA